MKCSLTELISSMHAELSPEYQLGAIQWADKHMHNAWTKAEERFTEAIDIARKKNDPDYLEAEAYIYKQEMLNIYSAYRRLKNINEKESFIKFLKGA
jgi:hypothetical protein